MRLSFHPSRLFASIVALASCALANADPLRTIALTGQSAPGTMGGATFNIFDFAPLLNDAGRTAFNANYLVGSGVNDFNDEGLWSEGFGSLTLVAREGAQAPGTPSGVTFYGFHYETDAVLNNAGQIAFSNGLVGPGDVCCGDGLWVQRSGSLMLVARQGNQAPGLPIGVTFRSFSASPYNLPVAINDSGQTAFWAGLSDTPSNNSVYGSIWSEGSGSLAPVARSGDQAPGMPAGVKFENFVLSPSLNDVGQTAFGAYLFGAGVDSTNQQSIWSEGSGALALIARQGSQAPGTPVGTTFGFDFSQTKILLNDAGQTAFRAGLGGASVDSTNNSGVWAERSGALALVVREGSPAPGMPPGVNFGAPAGMGDFDFGTLAFNNLGQTAFLARVTGSGVTFENTAGVWSESSSGLALVARAATHAPGAPADVTFSGFDGLAFNDAGQVAFLAGLSDGNHGIWATDRNGILQLIVRTGQVLELAPGDSRTIADINFVDTSTPNDGRRSGLNNLGQVAFSAIFEYGTSGIFVSNAVAVPEPTSLALVAITLLGCFASHRTVPTAQSNNPKN